MNSIYILALPNNISCCVMRYQYDITKASRKGLNSYFLTQHTLRDI